MSSMSNSRNMEFARRKPQSAQTKSKISRALKGKKKKMGIAASAIGAAAVGGLGYIGLKTIQKRSGKGMKSDGNNQAMRGVAGRVRGNNPLTLPSRGTGNKEVVIPTTKVQTAQMEVVSKPNMVSQAGAMAAKVPGAKNAYMMGQQARAGYEQGPSARTQSKMNRAAGAMGRNAAQGLNAVRKWTSRGKA